MNDPSHPTHSSLQKRLKLDRHNLQRIITDLVRRRQEHEQRINKLLDPNYLHQDITKSSQRGGGYQQFSEMLRKLEVQEPQVLQESIGSLGNHVNLLATVSLKTDYYLMEKSHSKEEGQLYESLQRRYGKRHINHVFEERQPQGAAEWMKILVKFLLNEELANGLFVQSAREKGKCDYLGTRFQRGKNQEVLLSREEITHQEEKFILVQKKEAFQTINISWLLLARLLKPLDHLNFPLAVHRLFSFPYKKFAIKESLQLIKFNDLLTQLPPLESQQHSVKMYGIEDNGQVCEIVTSPAKNKTYNNYIPIIHRFRSVLTMNEIEFPVKNIPLSCLKNHFVVVTLVLKAEGDYYISVGGDSSRTRYRLCLLDFQGNIVQFETINSGQFMLATLKQEQYQLYISPEGETEVGQLGEDESYELVKETQEQFSLWVQGSSVCTKQGDLQLQIRLKEQYNTYTLKIAKEYMRQWQEMKKQDIVKPTSESIIVKRYVLSVMDLVVDHFISPNPHQKMTIKYKEKNLCDQFFQENIVQVINNQCIVLRQQTQIQITRLSNDVNAKMQFKLIRCQL